MVVKFFPIKTGGGVSSINYLLNRERVDVGTARVLKGDDKLTRELIASMEQKHKTCVGCLSFEESNIDEKLKYELMQSFEDMLLTEEMRGRYNILWVEHTDKGRLELNFVIPKIDLQTQKAFNPYFHSVDVKRKDLWTDYINLTHNFSNPKDPAKEQTIQGSKKQIELIKDYEALDEFLHSQVETGLIESRAELVALLKDNGIEVTREGKDYLGIKLPDSQKAKRFKGGIYDQEFTNVEKLSRIRRENEAREREFSQRDNTAEAARIKRKLDELIQAKAEYYRERHNKDALRQHQHTSNQNQDFDSSVSVRNVDNADFERNCVVSVDKALSSIAREDNNNSTGTDLSNRTIREYERIQEQQKSNTYSLREQGNDHIRNRVNSRSREIAGRVRKCSVDARDNTARQREVETEFNAVKWNVYRLRARLFEEFRAIESKLKGIFERQRVKQEQEQKQQERQRRPIRRRNNGQNWEW